MTRVRIRPARALGVVRAPPSKSYTHRALAVGHLARRRYRVDRPLDSDDTRATARAVGALGTPVERSDSCWTVDPAEPAHVRDAVGIDCRESGTTLRFATALAALGDRTVVLRGRGRLPLRPMAPLVGALERLGATVRTPAGGRTLPLTLRGPIHGGRVEVDASESSQFASALLLVLPTLPDGSTLLLRGPIVSAPYLDATAAMLSRHGVECSRTARTVRVPGGQRYRGGRFEVPGDASSAAYLWAAAAVSGGEVRVRGIPPSWPQADLAILDLLERNGAEVRREPDGATVRGTGRRRPFTVNLTDAPDLYPLVGVLAATTVGRSELRGAPQVVRKESDRRQGTVDLARGLGATAAISDDRLRITGTGAPKALALEALSDHRLVMSAAVGSLAASGPSVVGDARAVRKSFPGFWAVLKELTGAGP